MGYSSSIEIHGFLHDDKDELFEWEKNELAQYRVNHSKDCCVLTHANSDYSAQVHAYPRRSASNLPMIQPNDRDAFVSTYHIINGPIPASYAVDDLSHKRDRYKVKTVETIGDKTYKVLCVDPKATTTTIKSAFGTNIEQVLNVSPFRTDMQKTEVEVFEVMASTEVGSRRIRHAEALFKDNGNEPRLSVTIFETPIGITPLEKLIFYVMSRRYLPAKKKMLFQRKVITAMIIREIIRAPINSLMILRDKIYAKDISYELKKRNPELNLWLELGPKALASLGLDILAAWQESMEIARMQFSELVVV
jgi:hypothetical protein